MKKMKKVLSVLLAVLMVMSTCMVAFVAFAEDETTTEPAAEEGTGIDLSEYPDWLVELINRLIQVLTKLLIKFGIKMQLKSIF